MNAPTHPQRRRRPTPPAQPRYRGRDRHGRMPDPREHYRAVNRFAVISVVLGALSILTHVRLVFRRAAAGGHRSGHPGPAANRRRARRNDRPRLRHRRARVVGRSVGPGDGLRSCSWPSTRCPSAIPSSRSRISSPTPKTRANSSPRKSSIWRTSTCTSRATCIRAARTRGSSSSSWSPRQSHCQFCQRDLKSTEMVQVTTVGDLLADFTIQQDRRRRQAPHRPPGSPPAAGRPALQDRSRLPAPVSGSSPGGARPPIKRDTRHVPSHGGLDPPYMPPERWSLRATGPRT